MAWGVIAVKAPRGWPTGRTHGQARDVSVVQAVLDLRERWPHWGPKKLRAKFAELHSELAVPAASTIGDWLRREGLVGRARRRRRCPAYTQPFAAGTAANTESGDWLVH